MRYSWIDLVLIVVAVVLLVPLFWHVGEIVVASIREFSTFGWNG